MASVELPDYGPIWYCEFCAQGPETLDGVTHRWQRSVAKIEHRDREEKKHMSDKPCPECRRPMWEITMPDFGARWQCENCRLTVFSSGGIQRWSQAKN
jgi:hypothetical protein